ncbi:MAG: substrate-binding domain-containing protein [Alphaproteobacteria bacterium]|nr:substrate-binding domain-containing protein [Alphaproteobacteria bacterium]
MIKPAIFAAAMAAILALPANAQEPLRLFGAGSLREAMTEIAGAYAQANGRPVTTAFGFSGLMRERIERGEEADVFASADMGHPQRLLRDGRATRVVLFTRNTLCLVAPAGTGLKEDTLVDRLLDASLPLGVFPAVQDPVGDYTLELFQRLDAIRPGANAALRGRAIVISESVLGRPLASGEDLASALLKDGRMKLHVSYCTTARRLAAQVPGLEITGLPDQLRVGPAYGLAVLKGARAGAEDLALFVLGEQGQQVLAKYGFTPVTLP